MGGRQYILLRRPILNVELIYPSNEGKAPWGNDWRRALGDQLADAREGQE